MSTRLAFVAVLLLAGCTPHLQRNLLSPPIARRDAIWFVEKDEHADQDDEIRIVVCNREGAPACVRVTPAEIHNAGDYKEWLESIPDEVRRVFDPNPPPETPACEAPSAPAPATEAPAKQ